MRLLGRVAGFCAIAFEFSLFASTIPVRAIYVSYKIMAEGLPVMMNKVWGLVMALGRRMGGSRMF